MHLGVIGFHRRGSAFIQLAVNTMCNTSVLATLSLQSLRQRHWILL